jgi:hypothetical protein
MLHNHQRKNTDGLSRVMIAMWLIGDCYKLGYYLEVEAPVPLIVCSLFSIVVDSIIIAQFKLYQEEDEKQLKLDSQECDDDDMEVSTQSVSAKN